MSDAMRQVLQERFERAQEHAGEYLSPWKPEGFAVIAMEAVKPLVAERDALVVERDEVKAALIVLLTRLDMFADSEPESEAQSLVWDAVWEAKKAADECLTPVLGDIP